MRRSANSRTISTACLLAALATALQGGCTGRQPPTEDRSMRLSHEETLQWINEHRAWRLAQKTKPIWARPVEADEIGREFQTADHAVEKAQEGYWLCAGVAGEPWFQKREKIEAKYDLVGEETKQFAFDQEVHSYQILQPKKDTRNWVAQIQAAGIEGFYIRPSYDMENPLYSPVGGWVVKNDVPDPYRDEADDVWLVQQALFESTYELFPETN